MDVGPRAQRESPGLGVVVRAFLIADIRGYSTFTRRRGDEAAARLAARFADLARDAVEARGGRVIELRGDEALAVFDQAGQAVRSGLEFQEACREAAQEDPDLPLPIGVGIDRGEAIPVEDGYRGAALNMAARLCSKAAAGQILVTRGVAESAQGLHDVTFASLGAAELKGFDRPVELLEAQSTREATEVLRGAAVPAPLPPELDDPAGLADREHELRWLRGTWRQVRRGRGRILFLSGPAGIGKTRLAAELAAHVQTSGGTVRYAGSGGAGGAQMLEAVADACSTTVPTLSILDELNLYQEPIAALERSVEAIEARPALVLGLFREAPGYPELSELVDRVDVRGDGHRRLSPLGLDGVNDIAGSYVGDLDEFPEFPAESILRASGGVPARVHEIVSEWARDEAKRRLAAAAEWLATSRRTQTAGLELANNVIALRLRHIYGPWRAGALSESCPYKGLAAFEEADSAYFYGRERLVGELAARTVGMGLLGVVGPSGSGKSSAVMAGLLPSLGAGLLPGSQRWSHVHLRPGEHPTESLQATLASCDPKTRLVLVVDQFEEAFTMAAEEPERAAFINRLIELATDPDRAVVIATIRADYTGHLVSYPELAELLASNLVLVPPMAPDELRRAIELPARRVGLRVESSLIESLVEEVGEEPGGLPLLSTALVELWLAREDGWLRRRTYERTGGVRGAVARLAETSFGHLEGEEREAARAVLLRLVGQGEGDAAVRRRVAVSEFDLTPSVEAVLTRFTQDRLLTASEGTVEIAHEALIREWPRLWAWLEEDVQGRQIRAHITQTAKQWEEGERDQAELYRGTRLSVAIDWAASHGRELNELEREFLAKSREAGEREAERQRRTNRRLRGLLVGTAIFLVLALVAGSLAFVQRGQAVRQQHVAEEQRKTALSRELAASATSQLSVDPALSVLLAIEAAETVPTGEAEDALRQAVVALIESHERLVLNDVGSPFGLVASAFSPDGKMIAAPLDDGTVRISDVMIMKEALKLTVPSGRLSSLAFSPDGRSIATEGEDATGRVWDVATGSVRLKLPGRSGDVWRGVAFSPDGRLIATVAGPRSVRVWDAHDGQMVSDVEVEGIFDMGFNSDGRFLWTVGENHQVWETATGQLVAQVGNVQGTSALSPDGRYLAVQDENGVMSLWDVPFRNLRFTKGLGGQDVPDPGPPRQVFRGHTGLVRTLDFSPDSQYLVSASEDRTARIWRVASGEAVAVLEGHTGNVTDARFSPDGKLVVTAGEDGTVRLWDSSTGGGILVLHGHVGVVRGARFSPDSKLVLTEGDDGTARVWSVAKDEPATILEGHVGDVHSLTFARDGRFLATGGEDGTARVWEVGTGTRIAVLSHRGSVSSVSFDPSGSQLATASEGMGKVWDLKAEETTAILRPLDPVRSMALGPAGKSLVTGGLLGVAVWERTPNGFRELQSWRELSSSNGLREVEIVRFSRDGNFVVAVGRHEAWAARVVSNGRLRVIGSTGQFAGTESDPIDADITPDGRALAIAGEDGTARLFDVGADEFLSLYDHPASVSSVGLSPDGRFLATGCADGLVRVWDVETGHVIASWGEKGRPILGVAFSPDGTRVAAVGENGLVRLDQCLVCGSLQELLSVARSRAPRTLTSAERARYLHEN